MPELEEMKLLVMEVTNLAKDALHIYVALLVYLGACLLFRWKAWDWKPVAVVLAVALLGEVWDNADRVALGRGVDWAASRKDLWNTLLAPVLLFLAARYTKVFARR